VINQPPFAAVLARYRSDLLGRLDEFEELRREADQLGSDELGDVRVMLSVVADGVNQSLEATSVLASWLAVTEITTSAHSGGDDL